jgi:hypothetical protein
VFPFLKKRLLVVKSTETELCPIEVSIEAIIDRALKLKTAIQAHVCCIFNIAG